MRLILASGSPRRRDLLEQVGVIPEVVVADVDEAALCDATLPPGVVAQRLALAKAGVVARQFAGQPDVVVLGADTIVVVDEKMLGKPKDAEDARRMLQDLSGRSHQVVTGVAMLAPAKQRTLVGRKVTRVTFRKLDRIEIDGYLRTGEPMDKAGGYGIQGQGALLVRSISGCYFNVVGLPLSLVNDMLKRLGHNLLSC